jgi:uncharacterized cupredoxin-like copper-binding protein
VPLGLTTGHEIGLVVVGGIFVSLALLSALVVPRFRPEFPGRRLPLFVLGTIVLFVGMMAAVFVFGKESKEAAASPAATATATTANLGANKIAVDEHEFVIALPGGEKQLKAGSYDFEVKNTGKVGHDLVISGPGAANVKTPVFNPGQTQLLKVTLKPGTYDFYCSVPGHKQAGMDLKVTVS